MKLSFYGEPSDLLQMFALGLVKPQGALSFEIGTTGSFLIIPYV